MKNFTITIFALLCVATAAVVANDIHGRPSRGTNSLSAAAPTPAKCPTMTVSGPAQVKAGEAIHVSAKVSGLDRRAKPEYQWSVENSEGNERNFTGQGTPTITIGSAGLGGETVIANVRVGPLYDDECSLQDALSTKVIESER